MQRLRRGTGALRVGALPQAPPLAVRAASAAFSQIVGEAILFAKYVGMYGQD